MSESDTPETELYLEEIWNDRGELLTRVHPGFARKLERERNEAIAKLDALQSITPESLASALWDCEQLRTGRFTQPQFRQLCEDVLTREMSKANTETP